MNNKFDIIQTKEKSEDNEKITLDQKVVRSLSRNNKTYSEFKQELKIAPSTLTSVLKRLCDAELVEDIGGKTYSLKSNPDLEKIILQKCPFKNLDELSDKIKESQKQQDQKFAEQKDALKFSLEKLQIEQSITKLKNDSYKLSDYGCIVLQHCIQCRKKVEDGSIQIITMFNHEFSSFFHYVIHPKCYVAKKLSRHYVENDANNCDHCGLTLHYDALVNQQNKFNWMQQLQFYLNKDEKHNLENRDRDVIASGINEITGEKLEGKDIQFLSNGSNSEYSSTKSIKFSVKITEKNVDKLLKKFRSFKVKSIDNQISTGLGILGSKFIEIESASDLDFKNNNTMQLSITDENYEMPLSFSNLEEFYSSLTKSDDSKMFETRINELFSILIQIRDKKMNEAKIHVDKLFDPISIITAHAKTPDYSIDYPDELGVVGHMEEVTSMQRVVKEDGKTYHPYCFDIIQKKGPSK
jgi:DNA-binding HxlR family transcriptional regulator